MDELLKGQLLIDDMAMAIAQGDDEKASQYYEEYKKIYEKITGKNLPISFQELKKLRKQQPTEQETEIEL